MSYSYVNIKLQCNLTLKETKWSLGLRLDSRGSSFVQVQLMFIEMCLMLAYVVDCITDAKN